jgi:hypothetical protein
MTMRTFRPRESEEPRQQPAGRRWGFGAHSVVPYLSHAPSPDAAAGQDEAAIRNPVFSHMDAVLRAKRHNH